MIIEYEKCPLASYWYFLPSRSLSRRLPVRTVIVERGQSTVEPRRRWNISIFHLAGSLGTRGTRLPMRVFAGVRLRARVARLPLQWCPWAAASGPLLARSWYWNRCHLRHKRHALLYTRLSWTLDWCFSRTA